NPATKNGLAKLVAGHLLWIEQLKAIALTLVLAVVGTFVIAYAVKMVLGLRPTAEVELAGLDISEHGEEGYYGERGRGHFREPGTGGFHGWPRVAGHPSG